MKKIIFTGNLGKDPQVFQDKMGNNLLSFSVAATTGSKDGPKVDWINVICSGKLMEICQMYLRKGSKVLVEGMPRAEAYTNKEGNIVANIKVFANSVEFLSSKENQEELGLDNSNQNRQFMKDEIPF